MSSWRWELCTLKWILLFQVPPNVQRVCEGHRPFAAELNSPEKDAFSIFHLNIRSLNKNLQNLKTFLAELGCGCQIICLTEFWCSTDGGNNSIYELPGYTSVHQVRNNGHGKVGVGVRFVSFFTTLQSLNCDLTLVKATKLCKPLLSKLLTKTRKKS